MDIKVVNKINFQASKKKKVQRQKITKIYPILEIQLRFQHT